MTSRLPSSTAMYFLQPHLHQAPAARNITTLVERFAQEGYDTLGVGKVYGGHEARRFATYGGNMGGFGPRPAKKLNFPMGHPLWDWGAYPDLDGEMPDVKSADWAAEQLARRREKPFLLAVGFWRPHVPMYAPKKWFDLHPLDKVRLPETLASDRDDISRYALDLTHPMLAPSQAWFVEHHQWRKAVQAYLASSTFVDHCVGRVLDALDATGHADDTIVVLFSDHGWHLGEKQRWAKRSLWEDSTRVPLIVVAPGWAAGRVSQRPVGLIDIFPTLLDLCSLPADAAHEGQSLKPLLKDPQAAWERPAITTFGPNNHAVRSTHFRYIRYADGSQELYDHRRDPNEWRNLAGDAQYAEVIQQHARWIPPAEKNLPPLAAFPSNGLEAFRKAEQNRKQGSK